MAQAIVHALIEHGVSASGAADSLSRLLDFETESKAIGSHENIADFPEPDSAEAARRFEWVISADSGVTASLHEDLGRSEHHAHSDSVAASSRFALTLLVAPSRLLATSMPPDHVGDNAVDAQIRRALDRRRVPYTVLHGSDSERVDTALRAIFSIANYSGETGAKHMNLPENSPTVWRCDDCSDPDCERRLFTDLIASRSALPPA